VIRNTSELPAAERAAMAVYLKSLPPVDGPARPQRWWTEPDSLMRRRPVAPGARQSESRFDRIGLRSFLFVWSHFRTANRYPLRLKML